VLRVAGSLAVLDDRPVLAVAGDELLARVGPVGREGSEAVPAPMIRAMENLKLALRLRIQRGSIDAAAAEAIAAALDAAAQTVERS